MIATLLTFLGCKKSITETEFQTLRVFNENTKQYEFLNKDIEKVEVSVKIYDSVLNRLEKLEYRNRYYKAKGCYYDSAPGLFEARPRDFTDGAGRKLQQELWDADDKYHYIMMND